MNKNSNYNLKVGAFIFTGLILFIIAIYILGRQQNLFGTTFRVNTIFTNVQGLQIGNNVRFSGINVGTVTDINIISDSTVKVEMSIEKDVQRFIREGSKATIGSEGLLGNKIIKILPGNKNMPVIKSGGQISSIQPIDMDKIMQEVNAASKNVSVITHNLLDITSKINRGEGVFGKIFTDTSLTANLDQTSRNLNNMTRDLSDLTSRINQGKGLLGRLVTDTIFSSHLSKTGESFEDASKNLVDITARIKKGEGIFGKIFTDTTVSHNFKVISDNLNVTSENTKRISKDLYHISHKMNKGGGMVNKLIADSAFADSVDYTLQNINKSLKDISETADAIEESWLIKMFSRVKKDKE